MARDPSETDGIAGDRSVSRRTFVATTGAVAGGVAISGCLADDDEGDDDGSSDDGSSDDSLSGDINVSGSSTVGPLMQAIAEEFMSDHPDVDINISETGSGGGFSEHFCPGETQFNNASRPIKAEEEELCEDNDVEWVELKAATDALTVVVNPDADWIDCVTVDELAQIWEPDAAETWDEVRDEWPNEEIERYGAAETSGTFDYFTENIVGEAGAHTDDYQATEQDNTIVDGVQGSEYAIGYFGFSYYYNNPDEVKALEIDAGDGCVAPDLETAAQGEYTPLSRPLFTYPSKDALAEEHVAEFAKFFVETSTDEDIVAGEVGYVPNTEEEANEQLETLEDAIDDVQG